MKSLWGERLTGLVFVAGAIYMGARALDFPAGGNQFPLFISACMILLGALTTITTVLKPSRYRGKFDADLSWDAWKPIAMLALALLYVIGIFHLGYFVSTFVFLVAAPLGMGLKRSASVLGAAAACVAFIYGIFNLALQARLPSGVFF